MKVCAVSQPLLKQNFITFGTKGYFLVFNFKNKDQCSVKIASLLHVRLSFSLFLPLNHQTYLTQVILIGRSSIPLLQL